MDAPVINQPPPDSPDFNLNYLTKTSFIVPLLGAIDITFDWLTSILISLFTYWLFDTEEWFSNISSHVISVLIVISWSRNFTFVIYYYKFEAHAGEYIYGVIITKIQILDKFQEVQKTST